MPVTVQAVLAARIDRLDPDAKQLLQVASVVGKEVSGEALRLTAGLRAEEIDAALWRADRGRLPLRSRDLPAAGARLPPPADPRGRLRHPARRASGRRPTPPRRGRLIELNPDRHDELAALIAHHLRGRAARRWRRRAGPPAPPTGPATAAPATRCASGAR